MEKLPLYRYHREESAAMLGVSCDACNRSHTKATYKVVLTGIPYDSRKFMGGDLKAMFVDDEAQEETYNVGVHCYKRTELYHRLHHYKYHLMERVQVIIQDMNRRVRFIEKAREIQEGVEEDGRECSVPRPFG